MLNEQARKIQPILDNFEKALALFYQGNFIEAEQLFNKTAHTDPPAAAYVEKCRALTSSPPDNWNGVWAMTEK